MNHMYTTDTSPKACAVQLALLRQMSPLQRLKKAFSLSRQVKQMTMDAIRRRHPDFDEEAIRLKFIELTYGKVLADEVRQWDDVSRIIDLLGEDADLDYLQRSALSVGVKDLLDRLMEDR